MGQDDVAKHLESRQSKHSIEIARGEKESGRVEKGQKGKQLFGRASQSRDSVTVAIGVVLIATHLRDRRHKLIEVTGSCLVPFLPQKNGNRRSSKNADRIPFG